MKRLLLAVAFVVALTACQPPDEHCALVPCSTVCLPQCRSDASTPAACEAAVALCEGHDAGVDGGP